jgi:hypothetical protein
LLPHPELCAAHTLTPDPWAPLSNTLLKWLPSVAEACQTSPRSFATWSNTGRFEYLRRCCANPMSRGLVMTLPQTTATKSCAASNGKCDPSTLYTLARRALLRLPWFGMLHALEQSLALLEHTLGLRLPKIPAETLFATRSPGWPHVESAPLAPSAAQVIEWRNTSATDFEIFELALGVLSFRLRRGSLLRTTEALPLSSSTATPQFGPYKKARAELESRSIEASSVLDTPSNNAGRRPAAVIAPPAWDTLHSTLVFVHLPKCGGTSFNRRLTTLNVGMPCVCNRRNKSRHSSTSHRYHNGHEVVTPRGCACPRVPRHQFHPTWSSIARSQLPRRTRSRWAFLQRQWLISPETTGWIGGVHAPARVLHAYLRFAAKLSSNALLANGMHFVTLLREPVHRFLSEFYETYDGWEVTHNTPPSLNRGKACSSFLKPELRERAISGIDNCTKEAYDELFPSWVTCPTNMAANRQTRALAYASLPTGQRSASNKADVSDAKLRAALCATLPRGSKNTGCSLFIARRALYQFAVIGLSSERCATERLIEAQFGLRFKAAGRDRAPSTNSGRGAHRVAKLRMASLPPQIQHRVVALNHDDSRLYTEAEQLFRRRLRAYGIPDDPHCQ